MNIQLFKSGSIVLLALMLFSCSKSVKEDTPPVTPPTTPTPPVAIVPGVDPPVANTIGFFLDTWQPKTFTAPAYADGSVPATAANTVTIDASNIITKIPSQIFAHNANTWMGTFVDQPSFITDITNLKPNIIRWPAGSGSDVYFWNVKPGDTPDGAPAKYMDKDGNFVDGWGYGRSTDNWRASLDNYYSMLQMTNNKGIITVNYGFARYGISADPVATAAHLAADWVRYDKARTQYWEIGNENYADWEAGYRIDVTKNKDGQPEFLTGKLYAQHFKVFADSMRKAAAEVGNTNIKIGAVIQESPTQSWQINTTQTWNSTLIPELNNKEDFFIAHNYITPYGEKSNAATVLNSALAVPASMMSFVTSEIKNNGGEIKPIAFTEWNMWAQDLKQQVSNTSGIFAIIVQSEAIRNKFGLAARWDLLNGWSNGNDHGLFSDGGSADDPRWNPRPSFYYMYYFQKCIGDRLVSATVDGTQSAAVKAYASTYTSGQVNVTLLNTSSTAQSFEIKFKNFVVGSRYYWYSLEGSNDNGEFSRKVLVNGAGPTGAAGGPANYATLKAMSAVTTGGIKVTVPALGAVIVMVDK